MYAKVLFIQLIVHRAHCWLQPICTEEFVQRVRYTYI